MKNAILLVLSIAFTHAGFCQGVFINQTNAALEKVVRDYPSQFKNIRGELVTSSTGSTQYKSVVIIPGSISTAIVQTVVAKKQSVSWQSVLYTGKGFAAAKTRFEELFNQIKNTIVKPEGEKALIVNGLYMDPSEEKTFSTIQFDLLPATGMMQKLNIDLTLQNAGKQQWKIILTVYDSERKEMESFTVK